MMTHLLKTTSDWPGLTLRLTAGFVMLPHGLQKTVGLFGGYGFKATMDFFTNTMKLPWIISLLIILIECFGSLGLLAGVVTRLWAAALIVIMAGAIITTNAKHGFFMNWFANQNGEGFEYHLLFIGICISLLFTGGGKFSIDGWIQ